MRQAGVGSIGRQSHGGPKLKGRSVAHRTPERNRLLESVKVGGVEPQNPTLDAGLKVGDRFEELVGGTGER